MLSITLNYRRMLVHLEVVEATRQRELKRMAKGKAQPEVARGQALSRGKRYSPIQ
jgi:hypothetical protein